MIIQKMITVQQSYLATMLQVTSLRFKAPVTLPVTYGKLW